MPELVAKRAPDDAGARLGARLLHGRGSLLASRSCCRNMPRTPSGTSRSRSSPPTSTRRRSNGPGPDCTRRASPPTSRPSAWRGSSRQEGDGYRVRKTIRDLVVFAVQDVIKDPPFSHLDLVAAATCSSTWTATCSSASSPLFHYALEPKAATCSWARRRRSGGPARCSPSSTRSGSSTGAWPAPRGRRERPPLRPTRS